MQNRPPLSRSAELPRPENNVQSTRRPCAHRRTCPRTHPRTHSGCNRWLSTPSQPLPGSGRRTPSLLPSSAQLSKLCFSLERHWRWVGGGGGGEAGQAPSAHAAATLAPGNNRWGFVGWLNRAAELESIFIQSSVRERETHATLFRCISSQASLTFLVASARDLV